MEQEKILIESRNNYVGKLKKLIIVSFLVTLMSFILNVICQYNGTKNWIKAGRIITDSKNFSYLDETTEEYKEYKKYMSNADLGYNMAGIFSCIFIAGGVVFISTLLIFIYSRKMKIVVTDKRVYGQASFGRQIDLPLDSISAIGKWFLKGIAVATSSGKIRFMLIDNRDNIYKTISDLLIDRQRNKQEPKQVNVSSSNADELKKYKELLDTGVITQEEFEAKKKQLLNL